MPKTPEGVYAISTINDKALPVAILADGTFSWEVTAGALTLRKDATYVSIVTSRQTLPGSVETFVDTLTGTWAQSGATVSFVDGGDGSKLDATWTPGKLSFARTEGTASFSYVYTLQK